MLTQLGAVIRTYGALVQTMPAGSESLESELAAQLAETHRLQDRLADLLAPTPCPVAVTETGHADADGDRAADSIAGSQWPLRGEILTHVDRLRTGLTADSIPREHRPGPARAPADQAQGAPAAAAGAVPGGDALARHALARHALAREAREQRPARRGARTADRSSPKARSSAQRSR